jgi:hypothetical protein
MKIDSSPHSADCDQATEKAETARAVYRQAWPNHCAACEGGGLIGSGAIDNSSGLVDIEPCDKCLANGKCPRCGADGLVDEAGDVHPCAACGWSEDNDDGMPAHHECHGDCRTWAQCGTNTERDERQAESRIHRDRQAEPLVLYYGIDVPPAMPEDGVLPVLDLDTMSTSGYVKVDMTTESEPCFNGNHETIDGRCAVDGGRRE